MSADSTRPSSSSFEGDFAPGHVLIGRYRIVALVGEGGMGQVYLADDLVLGQPVAVKFLPEHVASGPDGLERFHAEVRHAREVTHPNVARVHDIGEVEGRHFLTMEFVDGEDLSSLVRRIGRLPREKAAEIAQQICAGLAEAHRRGVLHRDLKPANVMLDSEGRVKLTDFGLAVAAEASADSALAGTPQYMAPEQLAGVPATVQSEVYALGLVLYELYTGRRALRGRTLDELRREHEEGPVDPPSSVLADIDTEVDAVLTRCLARDPADRPASVRAVARALPGGDPLAAALAAGETPAPAVVAAAETRGALTPRVALALLLGSALLLVGLVLGRTALLDQRGISYGKPPAVLDERARELVRELAGEDFAHEVHWYHWDTEIDELRSDPRDDGSPLRPDVQALVRHARFGAGPIVPVGYVVSLTDPAPGPGSAHVVLDAEGTLLSWRHHRAPADDTQAHPAEATVPESAWTALLERAGLDPADLRPVEPWGIPPVFASERRAWELEEDGGVGEGAGLRIQAAGLRGLPVHFEILRGEVRLGEPLFPFLGQTPGLFAYIMLALTGLAALLAWRNVRSRRAYVAGALAVGAFALVTHVILVFGVAVPDNPGGFGSALFAAVSMALHTAVRVTVFYLALEPFARRRWPDTLIAWSRLLEGRLRDPSLGREVLVGLFVGVATFALNMLIGMTLELTGVQDWHGGPPPSAMGLEGPLQSLSHVLHMCGDVVMFAAIGVFLLVLLRSLLPVPWLGNGLWVALLLLPSVLGDPSDHALHAIGAVSLLAFLLLLTRLGFLSVIAYLAALVAAGFFPLTLRPGDWYFTSSLMVLGALAVLGVWAYRVAVAGRSVFDEAPRST